MPTPEETRRSKRQMWGRIEILLSHMKQGDLSAATVTLELLQSLFYARIDGLDHQDLQDVYPRANWREKTVTIPMELLIPLVDAWRDYKSASDNPKIGKLLKLEGSSRGKPSQKATLQKINKHIEYANAFVFAYYNPDRKKNVRWDDAIEEVAGQYDVDASTVRTAVRRYRKRIVAILKELGYPVR